MNYFAPEPAAERYAKGRPYFHENTIGHVKKFLQGTSCGTALDIACGTGLSSKALLTLATTVYGTDASEHMLRLAVEKEKIRYSLAPAEQQPFADHTFDLLTVCSGVHWFNIDAFLQEANRLLKSRRWLVLYDNFFAGEMKEQPGFNNWFNSIYLHEFPAPARNDQYDWSNPNLENKNFHLVKEETFENPVSFTKEQLVLYFTTQSNIISAVEKGNTTYEEAERWLHRELDAFFHTHATRTVHYGNWIKYIQKTN